MNSWSMSRSWDWSPLNMKKNQNIVSRHTIKIHTKLKTARKGDSRMYLPTTVLPFYPLSSPKFILKQIVLICEIRVGMNVAGIATKYEHWPLINLTIILHISINRNRCHERAGRGCQRELTTAEWWYRGAGGLKPWGTRPQDLPLQSYTSKSLSIFLPLSPPNI